MRTLSWILLGGCLMLLGGLMSRIDHGPGGRPAANAGDAAVAGRSIFDTSVLHRVDIVVAAEHLNALEHDLLQRVPCTFTIDGAAFPVSGIRKKGGLNSLTPLDDKPAFSVKLDEFRTSQRLGSVDKIILNNGRQDTAFLNEHLGYEICRRAGLVAPRTAHALVTFNGEPNGIYVLREAVDRQFLERHFGPGDAHGNLYEGSCPYDDPCTDFLRFPRRMELKRENEEARKRDDLYDLIALIETTPDSVWIEAVSRHLDLDGFITAYAVSALTNHWDGYAWNMNNYYLYHRPSDDRFVLIPHGMDSLFGVDDHYGDVEVEDPFLWPVGRLARKVRNAPDLQARFVRTIDRVLREAWDVDSLTARIDRLEALLDGVTGADDRTRSDLGDFEYGADEIRDFIRERKASVLEAIAAGETGA